MGVILAPILEGKVEAWKQWTAELDGPRKAEFEDLNKRYGLTRHAAWLTEYSDRAGGYRFTRRTWRGRFYGQNRPPNIRFWAREMSWERADLC